MHLNAIYTYNEEHKSYGATKILQTPMTVSRFSNLKYQII